MRQEKHARAERADEQPHAGCAALRGCACVLTVALLQHIMELCLPTVFRNTLPSCRPTCTGGQEAQQERDDTYLAASAPVHQHRAAGTSAANSLTMCH